MPAQVHQLFASEADYRAAWTRFSEIGARLKDDPTLISDRAFMEGLWRAEREAKRLFNAWLDAEGGRG